MNQIYAFNFVHTRICGFYPFLADYNSFLTNIEPCLIEISMQVAIFLIQRNRHALIGRAIDDHDMERVLHFLRNDPVRLPLVLNKKCYGDVRVKQMEFLLQVVDAIYDCKSEVIGPGFFRFKAEIGEPFCHILFFLHFHKIRV